MEGPRLIRADSIIFIPLTVDADYYPAAVRLRITEDLAEIVTRLAQTHIDNAISLVSLMEGGTCHGPQAQAPEA